jgi:hypothetical protein
MLKSEQFSGWWQNPLEKDSYQLPAGSVEKVLFSPPLTLQNDRFIL